jgi:uncharacterized lipoprotein YmbA
MDSRRDFAGMQPDLRVQVVIEHLDAVPGEALKLQASWLIRPEHGVIKSGRATLSEPLVASSHEAVVAATGRVLLALSIDIAKDIQTISP